MPEKEFVYIVDEEEVGAFGDGSVFFSVTFLKVPNIKQELIKVIP